MNVAIGDERLGGEVDILLADITEDFTYYNGSIFDAPNVTTWEVPGTGGYALLPGVVYRVEAVVASVGGTVLFEAVDPATSAVLASTTITAAGTYALSFAAPASGEAEVTMTTLSSVTLTSMEVLRGAPDGKADHYFASIRTAHDYYPGGMPMPGRSYNPGGYRYGHNGQESDPELTGNWGSHYTAEYWMYDSRLQRRWEVDPITRPWESPYAAFANNPIYFTDVRGLSPGDEGGGEDQKTTADDHWQTKNTDGTYTGTPARWSCSKLAPAPKTET